MTKFEKFLHGRLAAALIATLIGVILAMFILVVTGYDPIAAVGALIRGTLGRPKYITNVFIKATPILLTGVGVSFAYKAGLFNIGAEGQYVLGMVCATVVGSSVDFPAPIQIPLVLLSGVVGGALLGAVIGFLKSKLGIHEVISSIMFNWIMFYLNNFVCASEAFHRNNSESARAVNPSSLTTLFHEWKRTDAAQEMLSNIPWLKEALLKTNMNAGILIAVAVALIASMVISRTKLGYELRAVGLNKEAAKFSGINVNRSIITSMGIAGAICGLSGALTVTGIAPYAISTMAGQDGSGFNGLSVAFMAGCSPIGCIPASILFSLLLYGGVSVQQAIGTPSEIINIMIGTIVFCMALPGIGPAIADALKRKRLEKENGTATLDAGSEG